MGILDQLKGYKKKAEDWNEQRAKKAEQDRTVRLEKRKQDLAWRKKELTVREDEDRINRREARLNNNRNAGSSFSFNPTAGGNMFDMGFGNGSYAGSKSKNDFNIFSMDMSTDNLLETGMTPRKKHKRVNKKANRRKH